MARFTGNYKNVANAAIVLITSLIAHLLACGTFISIRSFILLTFILVIFLTIGCKKSLSTTKLILLITSSQIASHYLLGSNQIKMAAPNCGMGKTTIFIPMNVQMSPWFMIGTHAIASVICFIFIKENEKFWALAERLVHKLKISLLKDSTAFSIYFKIDVPRKTLRTNPLINLFLESAINRIPAPPVFS
mgnify:FL=1